VSGVIEGGWEFVVAAYAVTAAARICCPEYYGAMSAARAIERSSSTTCEPIGAYATSVFLRFRSEKARGNNEAS